MNFQLFKFSITNDAPPAGLAPEVEALWRDANGGWEAAHSLVQDRESTESAWVHAYLHRKEGDLSNAGYWYRRAGMPVHQGTLTEEWEQIVRALL